MIKKLLAPFKALPLGYYRLFLLFWAATAIVCLAMPSNLDSEFEYRYNTRKIKDAERFADALKKTGNTRLPYKLLIAE